MSDLAKLRDSRRAPKRSRGTLSDLRDMIASAAQGYWDRQGRLAREGLAQADQGAKQVRGGNVLEGAANMLMGPAGYVSSPINALFPTEQEVYGARDLPEGAKPLVAGGLATMAAFLPGNKKGMGPPAKPRTLYHGTREEALDLTNDRPLYLTTKEAEARGYAEGQHLGGTGAGKPQVLAYQAKEGNALNIDDELFEAMDAGDDLDAVINAAARRAKAEGYRYLEYTHPSFTPGQEQAVTVSLFPKDDLIGNAPEGITAYHASPHTFDFSTPSAGTREAVVGDTTITYGVGKDGLSEVTLVKTPKAKRGQGSARAAMEAMIRDADAAGMRLGLNADPMDKGVSKSGLVKFYESLGFKRNAGNKRDFTTRAEYIREPKK